MGLKPFRKIPEDIIEWTRWMNDQDGLAESDHTHSSTTTTSTDGLTIKNFSASYTAVTEDANDVLLVSTSGSGVNVTIGQVFDVGDQLRVYQYGAGQVTVVAGTGVTIRTPTNLTLTDQYSTVTLTQVYQNDWVIEGRMTP